MNSKYKNIIGMGVLIICMIGMFCGIIIASLGTNGLWNCEDNYSVLDNVKINNTKYYTCINKEELIVKNGVPYQNINLTFHSLNYDDLSFWDKYGKLIGILMTGISVVTLTQGDTILDWIYKR